MKSISPKLSVIVPVYNAGDKLARCMDTLINQTMTDIEIIIILDTPTDGSDQFIKTYAEKDNRIVLITNKQNLHIGLSRNKGLEVAKGEYVGFSDHDDYRELHMYEVLYKYAKQQNADMVVSKMTNVGLQNEIGEFNAWNIQESICEIALKDLIAGGKNALTDPIVTNIHPNLYKTSVIRENRIRFVDTQKITPEDRLFNIEYLLHVKKVMVYDSCLYYHLIHHESEGRKRKYTDYECRAAGKQYLFELLNSKKVYDKYEYLFLQSVKIDFADLGVNALLRSLHPIQFIRIMRYLKTFEFSKKAFQTISNEVFAMYRFIGKTLRILFSLWMKYT